MRIGSVTLPCGAQLACEQDDWYGMPGMYSVPPMTGLVRCRLDRLPVTLEEAKALVNVSRGRYRGSVEVRYEYHGGMTVSRLELTETEADAIADGGDPLTVLGVRPARVVLSIVRLPAD